MNDVETDILYLIKLNDNARANIKRVKTLVAKQNNDKELWLLGGSSREGHLQEELLKLHDLIEELL